MSAEREERDAQELADPAGNARSGQRQISISTGSTSGRRPDRFLKNRRSSDAELLGHQPLVGPLVHARGLDAFGNRAGRIVEQLVVVVARDEAAGDELGFAHQRAREPADRDDGDDDAVTGEMPAVAQHLVADLADARDVDEDAAGRRLVGDAGAGPVELDDVAVLRQQHLHRASRPGQHALRDAGVLRQLPVFAVHRHEVARAHQRQDQLELLLGAVAGHVHVLHAVGDDVRAAPGHVAHGARDRLLVAGNRPRREHDRVVGTQAHEAVVVDGDARQRRLRLALRAGRDAQHVLRRVVGHVAVADLHARRHPQEAEALRDLGGLLHAAADERDAPLELHREIDQHLHAVDARREGARPPACPRCW